MRTLMNRARWLEVGRILLVGAIVLLYRAGAVPLPVLFAAVINPYTLTFTLMQAFAGIISLFVGPLPLNAPNGKSWRRRF